ncbi:MAG: DUF4333 domain-containing protein [Mycobacterium sp.]
MAGALGVGLMASNGSATTVLDITKVEQAVEQLVLDPVDGYGATTVTDVVCNDGTNPLVKKGTGFSCGVVVDGEAKRVAVFFQDDAGTYAVDRPR